MKSTSNMINEWVFQGNEYTIGYKSIVFCDIFTGHVAKSTYLCLSKKNKGFRAILGRYKTIKKMCVEMSDIKDSVEIRNAENKIFSEAKKYGFAN